VADDSSIRINASFDVLIGREPFTANKGCELVWSGISFARWHFLVVKVFVSVKLLVTGASTCSRIGDLRI